MADKRLTQLDPLAAFPANPAHLLFYVVDLTEPILADRSKRTPLALIDTRYQPLDADLTTIAGLAKADGNFIVADGAAWTVESGAVARASLGLGSLAVINSPLPIANGGSGQVAQQAAIDALTNVAAATNEHVLTKDTATGNAIYKAVTVLPVVDETAIVYETGTPANTLTFNVTPYTAPHTATWPNADMTVAGLEVANVFTAVQKINVNSTLALLVEQDGVKDNVLVVDTTNGWVGIDGIPTVELEVFGTSTPTLRVSRDANRWFTLGLTSANTMGLVAGSSIVNFTYQVANIRYSTNVVTVSHLNEGDVSYNFFRNAVFNLDSDLDGDAAYFKLNYQSDSSPLIYANSSLLVGVGTQSPANKLHVLLSSAATNTVTTIARLTHNSTGPLAAGFGGALAFGGESSTTNDQDMARLAALWQTATHASRVADLVAYASYSGGEVEIWRGRAGAAPQLGFLGAAPVARPTAYTLASTATRTMPTPEAAFTGIDNAQAGAVYAQVADLLTLQTRLNNVEGVLRQVIIDLASTSGFGLLQTA